MVVEAFEEGRVDHVVVISHCLHILQMVIEVILNVNPLFVKFAVVLDIQLVNVGIALILTTKPLPPTVNLRGLLS